MTAEEVRKLVEAELSKFEDWSNVFGLDLNKCLIKPRLDKYQSFTDDTISFNYWTVLEEQSDGKGYKITFDEDDNTFGLGMLTDKDQLTDMGTYGTFLDALKGM